MTQWLAEMRTHFGEEFRFLSPQDFAAYRRVAASENVWRSFDQINLFAGFRETDGVSVRAGLRPDIKEFNRERFEDLIAAGWDLVIVDEAHRIGGSSEQVARHQLGRGLAEASPYFLMLSATPHQGKSDAFYRLISHLDKAAFPDPTSVTRERVRPYVIRTEKRHAIDAEGKPAIQATYHQARGCELAGT